MRMRSTETMMVVQPSSAENKYTTYTGASNFSCHDYRFLRWTSQFGVLLPLSLTQYLSTGSQASGSVLI